MLIMHQHKKRSKLTPGEDKLKELGQQMLGAVMAAASSEGWDGRLFEDRVGMRERLQLVVPGLLQDEVLTDRLLPTVAAAVKVPISLSPVAAFGPAASGWFYFDAGHCVTVYLLTLYCVALHSGHLVVLFLHHHSDVMLLVTFMYTHLLVLHHIVCMHCGTCASCVLCPLSYPLRVASSVHNP